MSIPAIEIKNCTVCGSFAIQSLTQRGQYQVHCFNEFGDSRGEDCEQTGPETFSSLASIERWNNGERIKA